MSNLRGHGVLPLQIRLIGMAKNESNMEPANHNPMIMPNKKVPIPSMAPRSTADRASRKGMLSMFHRKQKRPQSPK